MHNRHRSTIILKTVALKKIGQLKYNNKNNKKNIFHIKYNAKYQ